MRRFSADYVYTLDGAAIENGIVVTDDNGKILAVTDEKALLDPNIERFEGIIVPGFVNTHCHLELSHLHKKIAKGKGLISFVKEVISKREEKEEVVIEAMQKADEEMLNNGIVAVGDVSNQTISAGVKGKSKIKYHTFLEMLAFDSSKSAEAIENAITLKQAFRTPTSITPHAPYSLSKELLKNLTKYCKKGENKITIHNQENDDENNLYRYKEGPFMDFFKELKIDTDRFKAQSKNSIQTMIPFLPDNQNILLVHNTYTSLKDIYFTKRFNRKLHWCFCPSANLYIENRFPTFEFFKYTDYPITLGTDSLASNQKLCILTEMKLIQKNFEDVSFEELLKWATINGAKFLGFQNELGSIANGKTPGLNLITNMKYGRLTDKSTVRKLI
jgi:cytosine/adenosine deaminase-related metal-dependent hydrolase